MMNNTCYSFKINPHPAPAGAGQAFPHGGRCYNSAFSPLPCSAEAATIGRHRLADGAARRRRGKQKGGHFRKKMSI
jgi:hypothetical protein